MSLEAKTHVDSTLDKRLHSLTMPLNYNKWDKLDELRYLVRMIAWMLTGSCDFTAQRRERRRSAPKVGRLN